MVAAIGGTPALKAVLERSDSLKLVPLAHWGWDSSTLSAVTYVIATACAAIGWMWTARSRRNRTILLAAPLLALISSFTGYSWIARTPPTEATELTFDVVGYIAFFLTQVAFGFLVARVSKEIGE